MGVSKVEFGGETLIDLTNDTVNPSGLLSGYTAHDSKGESIDGVAEIPTKVSQLENDIPFLKTNKNAKILFGTSGLHNATMKIEDIFSAMPTPSIFYYSTTNENDPIFTNNAALKEIVSKHSFFGTLSIVKNEVSRSHVEWTNGLSTGTKPYVAIIGIGSDGSINASNVIWVEGRDYPLTTSLSVTEEGVSALDGTVGKELNDKFGGCSLEQEGQDFYIVGADAVRKKLGESIGDVSGSFYLSAGYSGSKYSHISIQTLGKKKIVFSVSNQTASKGRLIIGNSSHYSSGTYDISGVSSITIRNDFSYVSGVISSASSGSYTLKN